MFTVFGGIDISATTSISSLQAIKGLGCSFVIVDAWGGHNPFLNSRENLKNATEAGFTRLAIYCFLNFDNRAESSADHLPVPKDQSGSWQIQQALLASGLAGPNRIAVNPAFVAVDVEAQWAGTMLPPDRVNRIADAVHAVEDAGFKPIIYARNDNLEWDDLTENSTAFSALPLWVPRFQKSIRFQIDDLKLDQVVPWQPFGGWAERQGKQYEMNVPLLGTKVDMNVCQPALFDVTF